MLTTSKKLKMLSALKFYHKRFLRGKLEELDESGTRLMINCFLTDVLGFTSIEEVKTEYMIRGTYADYVVQHKGIRHFLVEVKSLSLKLSDKHLRQAINYGANEGIEWALLTNGKQFDFYKILFEKPIDWRLVFSFDVCDVTQLKNCIEKMQFLHRELVLNNGLDKLWQKTIALDPKNVSGILYTKPIINFIRRVLTKKFKHKFTEQEIEYSINGIIQEAISLDDVRYIKLRKPKKKSETAKEPKPSNTLPLSEAQSSPINS